MNWQGFNGFFFWEMGIGLLYYNLNGFKCDFKSVFEDVYLLLKRV